jgi:hypothetical protein
MRHRRTWLITRWSRKQRQAVAEAAGRAQQEAEQRAARRRLLDTATTVLPLLPPPQSPLLTRGQRARARQRP